MEPRMFVLAVTLALVGGLVACDRSSGPPKPSVDAGAPPAAAAPSKPEAAMAKSEDKAAAANKALASRVRDALAAAPGLSGHAIDVTVSNGRISLFGTAATEAKRREIEKVAAAVPGVQSVENQIKIVSGS